MAHVAARPRGRWLRALLILTVVVLLPCTSACAKKSFDAAPPAGERAQAKMMTPASSARIAAAETRATATASPSVPFGEGVDVGRKLTREATVSLMDLEDAEGTLTKLEIIAREAGGYVGASWLEQRYDGRHNGRITLRVPAARFEEVLRDVRSLGAVRDIQLSTQDVTDRYVDLEARIANSEREEQELLRLYERGGDLSQIIQVETKLSEVRERIEVYKGQLRVLAHQVDLSTITVNLYEKGGTPPPPEPDRYEPLYHVKRAYRTMVSTLQATLTGVIYFLIAGWIVWLPLGVFVWVLVRRHRRKVREGAQRELLFEGPSEQPRAIEGTPDE